MATLSDLKERLGRVRSKERGYIAIQGICRVLVALVFVIVAFFLIDWIVDLPYGARLIAAGLGLLIVGYVAYRFLYSELRKIQDDDEMALRVEARNPDLRGRLISTLQLARTKQSGGYAGSNQMLAALEDETVRMSDPLDFSQIVSTVMLKRLMIAALIVVAIKVALIAQFPDHFRALAERLYNPEKQYPTKTRLKGAVKVPAFVARGDDIQVEITLDPAFVIPKAGQILFINLKSGTNIPVELLPVDGERFSGKLSKALEDVDVVVEIGDVRTKKVPVKVHSRPEIDTNRSLEGVKYTLPAYTEEPSPPPSRFGPLAALQGSTAEIEFTATKPLKSAVIVRADGKKFDLKALPAPAPVQVPGEPSKPKEPEGMTWRLVGFQIEKSGSFHVELEDANGLANYPKPDLSGKLYGPQPLEYPIDARPDLAPTIKLVKPTRDSTVTPTARPVIVYNARDDYGLRMVWLAYNILHENDASVTRSDGTSERIVPKKATRLEYKIDRDENKKLRRDLSKATITFDLAKINAKVGDQVVFWLECDDYCDANDEAPRKSKDGDIEPVLPGEKVYPRTQDVKLTVISRADKEAELRAELQRLYQLVERAEKGQEELKVRVLEIKEALDKLTNPK